jgi:predicted PurR-regulated permease PerM
VPQPRYSSRDLTRVVLSVTAIAALVAITLWIVLPFATAFLWATVIVTSTWPLLLSLQARLWGRRGMATAVLTVALLLMLLLPLGFSVGALVGNIDHIVTWVGSLDTLVLPSPPEWLAGVPVVGGKIVDRWQALAAQGPGSIPAQALPYARVFIRWFAAQLGGAGAMMVQFLMTVLICAVLYMKGDSVGRGVRLFFSRLAGSNGDRVVLLAANSIRGVAVGIVVTAIVQVLIAGTGLLITSVPGAWLLAAVLLFLCLAQLGPALIMIPAVIWQFYTGAAASGFILLVFTLSSMLIDNFLRPLLIRRGADLPLLLIFSGVIGGMISMGIMGIFLGPVILAVTFDLLKAWVENRTDAEEDGAAPEAIEQTTAAVSR